MNNSEDFFYISKTLSGETNAFSFLIDKYKNLVFTIVFRILKNKEDAEEIAQDSFVKAYQELNKFEGNSKFSTWLYTISYRLAISKTRKKKILTSEITDQTIEINADDFSFNQLEQLKKQEQKKYINLALQKLPEQDSLLLTLYYLNENTIDEIQQITDLSVSNIKVKLFRARKKIYAALELILKSELKTIL